MCAAADRAPVPGPAARAAGFTLIEVMIALAMLLVGGVGILAVFAVAAAHVVESKVAEKMGEVRFEAEAMAQAAVDSMDRDAKAPAPIRERASSVPGYAVSIDFAPSPNGDPSYVARIRISYRGKPTAQGLLPPRFVTPSSIDPERRAAGGGRRRS
jgi:prepilin-type N-terminal cleavage/methylation domain-containing protein